MTQEYKAQNVANGTWGECFINGEKIAEATALQAKISLKYNDVKMCGDLGEHKKIVGRSGKGTIKFNKVTSYFIKLISDNLKKGKQTVVDIKSVLKDPDAFGVERVWLKECTFDELTLADWEAGKNGEQSIPFAFADWEPLDLI
ncbi:phage tail tube protein [Clostridium haemolyticum]|uniref:Phage portal protein n=1 Tax=Clostridium haemolyticum NCTC 9693 TaxID=1443114 RepID=A0ABR4TGR5_CLOHA|nr:phage tail tube protein [Clostridium haemolyticum]KEI18204.1 phage portal protein [Clostridium haemolyticum NCTC 9693]KGN02908.1 phage portal protein [Clostridium haemolyticum NCTC 8350]